MIFFFWLFIFGFDKVVDSFVSNEISDNLNSSQNFCVCVPYWQCKEDYSGLVEEVIDIIDIRRRSVFFFQ